MSLPVDRDLRRAEVARTAYDIVAQQGLDVLTVRAVAKARACSTAVVSHYFRDKRDLLVAVYSLAAERTFARWTETEARGGALRSCLTAALPLDQEMQGDWRVHIAFWSVAAIDPALADIQNAILRQADENVLRLLRRDPAGGRLDPAVQERVGRQLLSLQMGIATQASLGPEYWSAARQVADLTDGVERLLGG